MELETLIQLADEWSSLGWAIQEQARAVLDDSDTIPEQNPAALSAFKKFLKTVQGCGDDEVAGDAVDQLDLLNEAGIR